MSASPDPAWKTSNDLRQIGETLVRISRALHEHTRKLEVAVEGTYAHEGADPRVRLLNDSLRVSRVADLELGRLNQATQRVLLTIQEQLDRSMQAGMQNFLTAPTSPLMGNFEREREALNTSINKLKRERNELETLYDIARTLNSTLEFEKVLRLVMDEVITVVNAERGYLVLVNPRTRALEFTIARDKQRRTIDESEFKKISRSTVNLVVSTQKPVLSDDAYVDEALKAVRLKDGHAVAPGSYPGSR